MYVAELMQLYWDDTVKTPYEIDAFKQTKLGSAVYKYGRYISAIKDTKKQSSASGNQAQASAGSSVASKQPKNNYKQSGSKLGNVRDLLDLQGCPAGTRLSADTNNIYYIRGELLNSKNAALVYIKPLSSNPKHISGNTNKVLINSGRGYGDCTCFFDDPNDATAFLDAIIKAGRVPADVTNLAVTKRTAENIKVDDQGNATGGYFAVGTEFGPCVIKAATINESLSEEFEEKNVDSNDWDKATENYTKEELKELHTWMRRG